MEVREQLAARLKAARGEEPADLVIKGGRIVNVLSAQVQETDVAVYDGVVVGLGDYQGRETLELDGKFVCPGFIEGHLHVESTFLTPAELARAVCPRGTSVIVADPHEIANVMGLAGVRAMLTNSEDLPVTFYFNAPSSVPATHMETAGASLEAAELIEMASWPRILGLAEVMNFPGAVAGAPDVLDKILAFEGRPMDGHAPLLSGKDLNAYILAGPESDHECTLLQEAAEKLGKGMWVMVRQGTSAQNLADLLPLVNERTERRCLLVSDDRHPDDLAQKGHLDSLLRLAVSQGLDPMIALRMVTLNPARRFGLARRGALAPGYAADLVVLDDLKDFKVRQVFKNGRLAAKDGRLAGPLDVPFSDAARDTMRMPAFSAESFRLPVAGSRVRVIKLVPGQILTKQAVEDAPARDGLLAADPARDLARLFVLERHKKSGRLGMGLVKGLGLKKGALASSVAHDSHNLMASACDDVSLLTAVRKVGEMGGGLCVALGERVLGAMPLPLAGLMSDKDLRGVLDDLADLRGAAAQVCSRDEPFMFLSFLALPVIPELRLTDRGLVDVNAFKIVELFLD